MADNEKFELVSGRRRGRKVRSVISSYKCDEYHVDEEFDVVKFNRKLNEAKEDLTSSEYIVEVYRGLEESSGLSNAEVIREIVCYGLGNFSRNRQARYQLALLLLLKDRLNVSEVFVYDPLFFRSEIHYLITLDCRVSCENEEGKRRVGVTTLAYLPHCPKQLTNNFLFANWNAGLKNLILFSNSFKSILESHTSCTLRNSAAYIVKIIPFVKEIELRNSFKYADVFNDSSIHLFIEDNLKRAPDSFWEDKEEPVYAEDDIEFISNSIARI